MAIPKKGSRKITVDGVEYRWLVRWKPTYSQAICQQVMSAAVELYENPQCTLLIGFPWYRYDAWLGTAEQPVTPKIIETSIKTAISQGWKPNERGQTFTLVYEKE